MKLGRRVCHMTKLRPQGERQERRRTSDSPSRTYWYSWDLGIHDEPLALSLLKYRQKKNRIRDTHLLLSKPNLISSKTDDGRHLPIIDLDFPHEYVASSQDGHGHLYLNVPISHFRLFLLMTGLYLGKQIELGYYVWSLRRGGNFARLPGIAKTDAESGYYTYGWFKKLRVKK
jgi:hypothetical protein